MDIKILSSKELEKLDPTSKKEYFDRLREYSKNLKRDDYGKEISKKLISKIAPMLRTYDLDIIGRENIPSEASAVFICNHSNSHDFFTTQEVFSELGRKVTPFGADDCLNFFTLQLFKAGDVTLINRDDKQSAIDGMLRFSKKIIDGKDGVIFGESTWNLHPIKPMQPIKVGGTQTALIADTVVVPTIFEYVEVPDVVSKEKELYKRCIVSFGKPIVVKATDDLFAKTMEIQKVLEKMRIELWEKLNIKRRSLDDINKEVYLNHTYLKKFEALGFEYDSEHEFQYLLKDKNGQYENEFHLDENGNFVPGITHKRK